MDVTRSPFALTTLGLFYAASALGIWVFIEQRRNYAHLEDQIIHERALLEEQNERESVDRQIDVSDVFRKLSFSEAKVSASEQDKLHSALDLNSFARYALDHHDLPKAKQTLEQSLRLFPTQEAKYYLGVVAYLQNDSESSIALWEHISTEGNVPSDVALYLAVAEYKAGNIDASRKYAGVYSRAKTSAVDLSR
jgi:hypothetical protein